MKLSIDSGTVVCSLNNKNSEFLSACAGWGIWDGYLNGKLKMRLDKPEKSLDPDYARETNAQRIKTLLLKAHSYGIETDECVIEFNEQLQSIAEDVKARQRAREEEQKQREHWERLCRSGCGKCEYLTYYIDVPICEKTGTELEEKNVQKFKGGVLHLFNFEPFPSENCPFNKSIKRSKQ